MKIAAILMLLVVIREIYTYRRDMSLGVDRTESREI